jgi:hypothetical protein
MRVRYFTQLGAKITNDAIAHEIEQAGAHLKVVEQSVDTSSAAGRTFYGMLAVFAAFETDVRRERQLEGIAKAKRQGVYKGGKARLDRQRVQELSSRGLGPAAIARELGNDLAINIDGREVIYPFGELDEIVLAFATTIHKSQGSEYPAVVIPVVTQHYAMLQRNLLYTGLTRGKQLVVLIGQKKAVGIAVRGVQGRRRRSKLEELLTMDDATFAAHPS